MLWARVLSWGFGGTKLYLMLCMKRCHSREQTPSAGWLPVSLLRLRSTSSTWILWVSWGWTQTVFWATASGKSSAPTAQRPRSCCPADTWLEKTTLSQLPSKVISPDPPGGVFTIEFYQSLLGQETQRSRNFLLHCFFLFLSFIYFLLFSFDKVTTWVKSVISASFQPVTLGIIAHSRDLDLSWRRPHITRGVVELFEQQSTFQMSQASKFY